MSEQTVIYRGFVAAFLSLAMAGCFFVQPINSAPQARINKETQGPHYRGDTITMSANKSGDADGEPLMADWKAFTCSPDGNACDAPSFASKAEAGIDELFTFAVPSFRDGTDQATTLVLVTVTITDTSGATHDDQLYIDVLNRAPSLDLQVQGFRAPTGSGYPLSTSMRILAAAQDPDGDEVTLDWLLYPAQGSDTDSRRWEEVNASTYELEPDITGLWMVEVKASDGAGGETSMSESILVQEDALPCIASTEPAAPAGVRYILDRDDTRRFAVLSVHDDLDVYPPPPAALVPPMGNTRFRWFLATPDTGGALVEIGNHEVADFLVDASAYAPGDRIMLRVEIDDRAGRDILCDPGSSTCALDGNMDCPQRLTWEVEVR